jgi:hypothetical protein
MPISYINHDNDSIATVIQRRLVNIELIAEI